MLRLVVARLKQRGARRFAFAGMARVEKWMIHTANADVAVILAEIGVEGDRA